MTDRPRPSDEELGEDFCRFGCYWPCEHRYPPHLEPPAEPPPDDPELRAWRRLVTFSVNE